MLDDGVCYLSLDDMDDVADQLYTGTVYETELVGFEGWGSVSSGGRYDSLASDGKTHLSRRRALMSVTRLLAPLFSRGLLTASRPVPTVVLVAVDDEETRDSAVAVAERLRSRGIATEVAPKADKFGKQIRYADRRRIPYVWFGAPPHSEIKDIRTGEQLPADPDRWEPDTADLRPTVSGPA